MPLYADSVIFNVRYPPARVQAGYGSKATIVTETKRPARIFDVWITSLENADVLVRYRGEYRLGIIASEKNPRGDALIGDVNQPVIALGADDQLVRVTPVMSGAVKNLIDYRLQLPNLEAAGKKREWKAPPNFELFFPIDLEKENINSLAAFQPYLDMVKRAFAAVMPFFGLGWDGTKLSIIDEGRFLENFVGIAPPSPPGAPPSLKPELMQTEITRILRWLRQMAQFGSETVQGELDSLSTLMKQVLDNAGYTIAPVIRSTWEEEIGQI